MSKYRRPPSCRCGLHKNAEGVCPGNCPPPMRGYHRATPGRKPDTSTAGDIGAVVTQSMRRRGVGLYDYRALSVTPEAAAASRARRRSS